MIRRGGILLAALLAVSSALAGAANATQPHHRSTTLTTTQAPAKALAQAASVTCTPGHGTISRTTSCSTGLINVNFYLEPGHQYQGTAQLGYTSSVTLNPRTRYKWTDDVTLKLIDSTIPAGDAGEATVTEDCSHCTATGSSTQILTPGATRSYHLTLKSPGRATVTDRQAPQITYTAAPYTPAQGDLGPKLKVRCDNTRYMGPSRTGGCVYPQVFPTYTISTTGPYDQVAWHIAWAQNNLKNHWGWRGHGPALSRTVNKTLIDANRDTACPKSIPRPAGKSCDEYPFASTNQGAFKNPDFSCHMVPEAQNRNEGRYRQSWYNSVRLFQGDKFWVKVTLPPTGAHAQAVTPMVQCP